MSGSPHVVVFGTSLDPESRSQVLARELHARLGKRGIESTLVDLRDLGMPSCGAPGSYEHPATEQVRAAAGRATHVVFSAAVYNYQVSASAKNLIELLGSGPLQDKTVGLMCSAGAQTSYMSLMSVATALMLDFRCWIVPRFVFALRDDIREGELHNPDVATRVDRLIDDLLTR